MGIAGAPTPALLNSRSSRPKLTRTCSNKARTETGSLTSVATGKASALPEALATSLSGSRRRPASATL